MEKTRDRIHSDSLLSSEKEEILHEGSEIHRKTTFEETQCLQTIWSTEIGELFITEESGLESQIMGKLNTGWWRKIVNVEED